MKLLKIIVNWTTILTILPTFFIIMLLLTMFFAGVNFIIQEYYELKEGKIRTDVLTGERWFWENE